MNLINIFIVIASLFIGVCVEEAEILKDPKTQYALEGSSLSFHCDTAGFRAYWKINNETISLSNSEVRQRYIALGFVFPPASSEAGYYNLTLHVLASEATNNSCIECRAITLDKHYARSRNAYLVVFRTFSPGEFLDDAISHTLYFNSNGTPLLTIGIKLPYDLWPNQVINYTIIIEDMNLDVVKLIGPFSHVGPGTVSYHNSNAIERDTNYSLRVEINSLAGSSESRKYYFATILSLPSQERCKFKSVDMFAYKLAMGISIVLSVLMSFILIIVMSAVFFNRCKSVQYNIIEKSTANVCNAMVHNPIYDGPVYDSVHPQFESLTSTVLQAAEISNSSSCNSQCSTPTTASDNTIRYADPPCQIPKVRSNSFVTNTSTYPSAPDSDAKNVSRSTSVSIPAPKKNAKREINSI